MKTSLKASLRRASARGTAVSGEAALAVLKASASDMPEIMAQANALRLRFFGAKARLCSIMNAKSGACGEDCAFCAQSACHRTKVQTYPLRSQRDMIVAIKNAARNPIDHFGIVTSGGVLDGTGVERICDTVRAWNTPGVAWCASLGGLNEDQFKALKKAGLKRFHHNIETAPGFFSRICTTHTIEDRLATLRAAKRAGLEVCSGGILGMGESLEQRVEMAQTLAKEKVHSIPLNFLVAIDGTRLAGRKPMTPMEILKTISMFRFVNPKAEIKVCAGRLHLRDLQSMIFHAGATGMMIGDLLTVAGREVARDIQMLKDLDVL